MGNKCIKHMVEKKTPKRTRGKKKMVKKPKVFWVHPRDKIASFVQDSKILQPDTSTAAIAA